jgi:predicted DNA-binding transcriptional regulator AlpA
MIEDGNTGSVTKAKRKVARYMSRTEVAEYLGLSSVNSLSRISLPTPDAVIGTHRGWLKSTIDRWNESRPGPGWHGARDDPRRKARAKSA